MYSVVVEVQWRSIQFSSYPLHCPDIVLRAMSKMWSQQNHNVPGTIWGWDNIFFSWRCNTTGETKVISFYGNCNYITQKNTWWRCACACVFHTFFIHFYFTCYIFRINNFYVYRVFPNAPRDFNHQSQQELTVLIYFMILCIAMGMSQMHPMIFEAFHSVLPHY